MKKKPFLIAVLIVIVSVPFILFTMLSTLNCGFMNDKLCCVSDERICCMSLHHVGCVNFIESNKDILCPQYCFEAQNKFLGGIQEHLIKYLSYCTEGCEDYPCKISLLNGTSIPLNCTSYGQD